MAVSERLSLEEFLALPEKKPALEYENGWVTQKVSPQGKHSRLQLTVANLINAFTEPRRLALAFPELRTTFGGFSRVPDVSVYRWDRIPRDPNGEVAERFLEPPDVAVEIASPEQRINYLVRRCLWYVNNGVGAAVLVNARDRSVRVFRPDQPMVVLHGQDEIDLDEILPGFRLTVEDLFDTLTIP
jgi:Uma2 family endonuclease